MISAAKTLITQPQNREQEKANKAISTLVATCIEGAAEIAAWPAFAS